MSGIEVYNDLFQIQIQFRLFKNFGFGSRKSSGFGSRKSSGFGSRKSSDIINQKEEESNCYQFKKKHSTVFSLQLRQKRSKILIWCLCIYLGFLSLIFTLRKGLIQNRSLIKKIMKILKHFKTARSFQTQLARIDRLFEQQQLTRIR